MKVANFIAVGPLKKGRKLFWSEQESPGVGVLPYKSEVGACRKILRTSLKGTRILFHGRVPNSFPPLKGTNSITTSYITGINTFSDQ